MCKKLCFLVFFALVLGTVLASTSQGAIPVPVAYWKLDVGSGTIAADSVGSNDGTLMGGTAWVGGQLGNALYFDGVDDYVNIGNDPMFNPTGSFSITFWAYITNWGTAWAESMFSKGGDQDRGGWSVRRYNDVDANQPLCFTTAGLAGVGTTEGADDRTNMPGKRTPPIGEWFHIACVCDLNRQVSDSNQTYIYINGVVDVNRPTIAGGFVAANIAPVYLGTRSDITGTVPDNWTDSFFNGKLDDVRYYDIALSEAEVNQAMQGLIGEIPPIASKPSPANWATDVEDLTPTLRWKPGPKAVKHDVYFSDNFDDVNDANSLDPNGPTEIYRARQDANSYTIPETLEWGKTYYWRINEVNDPNIWRGSIWRFTTRNYSVVDDFEDYNNTPGNTIIWQKWKANSTGKAGYSDPCYAELTIVHGGDQSLPFDYNNVNPPNYSDVNRTFDSSQDWTTITSGLYTYHPKSLTLWFRGYLPPLGSFVESPATKYTMTASGADVGDVRDLRRPSLFHDELHYAYKKITAISNGAVVEIKAKVEDIITTTTASQSAKAGVMFRNSLDANSTEGFAFVMPTSNIAGSFRYRLATGSTTSSDTGAGITDPCWVRLTITYNSTGVKYTLRGYHSTNGTSWTLAGVAQTITAGSLKLPLYIGLAVTSRDDTARCIAKFSNVSTSVTGTATITPATWSLHQDIGIKSNVAAPLYVTLQDSNSPTPVSKTVNHPDNPYMVLQNTWQEWDIPFSDFTGVDMTKVKKITLGVGSATPSGVGTLYFDDIRLYLPRCIENRKSPDFTGTDCLVDYSDLQVLTNNWLVSNYQVTAPVNFYPDTDPNLEAWYNLESNLNDSSTHGRTGDPCGNTLSYVTDHKVGTNSLSLNGVLDTFAVPQMVKDDFTLMAWIKTSTPGAVGTRAYQGSGLIWSDVTADVNDFIMAVLGTKLSFATGPNQIDTISSGNVVFNPAQWVHVAVTRVRSSGQVKLYIDGMLDTTAIHDNPYPLKDNPKINIGGNPLDLHYYTGLIDDVRIYSRALSHGEIAQIAGKTMPFNQPLDGLLTQHEPAINMYNDGVIDLKDYANLANVWLETLLWP